jgi:uncharacterized repeat protein (TIGR02543 family)
VLLAIQPVCALANIEIVKQTDLSTKGCSADNKEPRSLSLPSQNNAPSIPTTCPAQTLGDTSNQLLSLLRDNSPPLKDKFLSSAAPIAEATSIGHMQEGFVDVFVVFGVRNGENLGNLIDDAHRQFSGQQEVLSEEQFEADYAPAKADYEKVMSFMNNNNLSVTQTWANRLLLAARGSVKDVEDTFNVVIGLFDYKNMTFYRSQEEIKVPALLSSLGVAGIEINSFPVEPDIAEFSGIAPDTLATNRSPNDLRNAYGTYYAIQNGWNGTGTTIGIVDAYGDPTISSDVNSFNSYYGLPSLALTVSGTGGNDSGWAEETALDVEWAHAMAPGAAIRLQLSSDNLLVNMFGAFNTLISLTNPPNVISLSWSATEGSWANLYSTLFSSAASRGIKVYVSTGDKGAYNGGTSISVNYPASDPNVIAVGGTVPYYNTVQGTDEYYEYGWSGSGGGYSSVFTEPAYQFNAGILDPGGMRALPDVSLEASPGVAVYEGGILHLGVGGTSLSAPLMAGIAADALNGGWNLDNNALYSLYSSNAKYKAAFHDIYLGGNNGYYGVQAGWDAVTGLGSINFQNFANIFSQPGGVTLTGQFLNPHSITFGQSFSMNYTISNPNPSYSLIQIGLGASIRMHGSTTVVNDSSNDIYVIIPGGVSTQTRQFATASSLIPGLYDVLWTVWMGPPGQGNVLSSSDWQSNQLQVSFPSFNFTFAASGLDSTSTGAVLTVDGVNYTYSSLPLSLSWAYGSTHSYTYTSNISSSIAGEQFALSSVSGPSSPINVSSSATVTGNYRTQYYLTVTSLYGTAGGAGWYDSGTSAFATVAPLTVVGTAGTQYAFTGWSGDASGTTSPSNAITMNASKIATANWKTQYYITVTSVHGSPTGSAWVDQSGSFAASVTSPTETVADDHQWVCAGYSLDGGSSQSGNSYTFANVQAAHTIVFNWKEQFYLTVNSAYGSPTGGGWYDSGASANAVLSSETVAGGTGVQHVFAGWNGDASGTTSPSNAMTMNGPKIATANWKTQYFLNMSTNFGSLNPGSVWHDAGSTATISATAPSARSGEQYVWNGWTGTGSGNYTGADNAASVTMNGPVAEEASWTQQYYLTVTSPFGSPTPTSGWFDAGSAIQASVSSPVGGSIVTQHVCTGWAGTGSAPSSGTTTDIFFTIGQPSSITWNWKTEYLVTNLLVIIISIALIGLAVYLLLRRKRNRKNAQGASERTLPPPPAQKLTY